MFVLPDVTMGQLLTAIQAILGTVSTGLVHIHLFVNNLTPTKNNVLGDFTELTSAEVPGYAAASANWYAGVPRRLNTGAWEDPSSLADPSFICAGSAPGSPTTVYGWFATDSTNAILLGSGRFAVPFTFTLLGDGFSLPGSPQLLQASGGVVTWTGPDLEPN
jgi:hypothetical protein